MESSNSELLDRFVLRQDEGAFEEIVRRHGPMVMAVCRRVLREHAESEDAFQATFLVLARKADTLRNKERLSAWLYEVAVRISMEASARVAKRRRHEKQASTMPRNSSQEADAVRDLKPLLDEELQRLPEKYRAPLVLCHMEGLSVEGAAQELGWVRGTVAGRLSRARDLLRERLIRRGVTLSVTALTAVLAKDLALSTVPPALLHTTVQHALVLASGKNLAPGLAMELTQGALQKMFFFKVKVAVACVTLVFAGLSWSYWALAAETPPRTPALQTEQNPRSSKKAINLSAKIDMDIYGLSTPLIPLLDYLAEKEGFELSVDPNARALLGHMATQDCTGGKYESEVTLGQFLAYLKNVSGLQRRVENGKLLLDVVSIQEVLEKRRPLLFAQVASDLWPHNLIAVDDAKYTTKELEEGKLEDAVLERLLALSAWGVHTQTERSAQTNTKVSEKRAARRFDYLKLLKRVPPLSEPARAAVLLLANGLTLDVLKPYLDDASLLVAEAAAQSLSKNFGQTEAKVAFEALLKSKHPRIRAYALAPWSATFAAESGAEKLQPWAAEAELHLRSEDVTRQLLALSAASQLAHTLRRSPSVALADLAKLLLKAPDPLVRLHARQFHLMFAKFNRVDAAFALEAMRDDDPANQCWGVDQFWQSPTENGTKALAAMWDKTDTAVRKRILQKIGTSALNKPLDQEDVRLMQEVYAKALRDPSALVREEALNPKGGMLMRDVSVPVRKDATTEKGEDF